jgi:hypothetical protein
LEIALKIALGAALHEAEQGYHDMLTFYVSINR